MFTIALPEQHMLERLAPHLSHINLIVWRASDGPAPCHIDLVVLSYLGSSDEIAALNGMDVAAIQAQTLGYDGLDEHLPAGISYCNAVGVHEASTAELAVGFIIAEQRGFGGHYRDQQSASWNQHEHPGVAGSRILVIGAGGVGNQIVDKLAPFEADTVRLARTGRTDTRGTVHPITDLAGLLPTADIVVLAVPLTDATTGFVDATFLATMKSGALLVNVARGKVVDTAALVAAASAGRIRAALDVTDPEPLPEDHPLWSTPGITVTPHIGGFTSAMHSRFDAIVVEQARRIIAGEALANVVASGR